MYIGSSSPNLAVGLADSLEEACFSARWDCCALHGSDADCGDERGDRGVLHDE